MTPPRLLDPDTVVAGYLRHSLWLRQYGATDQDADADDDEAAYNAFDRALHQGPPEEAWDLGFG